MKTKILDVKSLVIGLLLGVCVVFAIGAIRGEAPQKGDADYRYQIGAMQHQNNGESYIYILDHESNKVYRRQFWDNGQGFDVKRAITEGH